MQILGSLKLMLSPLIDPDLDPRIFIFFKHTFRLSVTLLIVAHVFFITENIHDFTKVTYPSYVLICFMLGFVKWSSLNKNKEQIRDILELLQATFDEREYIHSEVSQ